MTVYKPIQAAGGGRVRALIKRLIKVAAACVLLFVLFLESPAAARGQGTGVYRRGQGRRVGGVTLPTPPFNPDAGILNSRRGRGRNRTKVTPRRPVRRSVKPGKRNPNPGLQAGPQN
jgi:hypothetical protein